MYRQHPLASPLFSHLIRTDTLPPQHIQGVSKMMLPFALTIACLALVNFGHFPLTIMSLGPSKLLKQCLGMTQSTKHTTAGVRAAIVDKDAK